MKLQIFYAVMAKSHITENTATHPRFSSICLCEKPNLDWVFVACTDKAVKLGFPDQVGKAPFGLLGKCPCLHTGFSNGSNSALPGLLLGVVKRHREECLSPISMAATAMIHIIQYALRN